jgi:hypothetical protein
LEKDWSSRTHWVRIWDEEEKKKAYKGWVKEFGWLILMKRNLGALELLIGSWYKQHPIAENSLILYLQAWFIPSTG